MFTFSEAQIIGILREQEAGAKTGDLARKHGVSEATLGVIFFVANLLSAASSLAAARIASRSRLLEVTPTESGHRQDADHAADAVAGAETGLTPPPAMTRYPTILPSKGGR